MKKVPYVQKKIFALLLFLLLVFFWVTFVGFCPIKKLTGIPCPGCGMTRAWICVFHLDIAGAFRYHPMFWTLPVFMVFAVFDFQPFKNKLLNILMITSMFAGIMICYVIRLIF